MTPSTDFVWALWEIHSDKQHYLVGLYKERIDAKNKQRELEKIDLLGSRYVVKMEDIR